MRITDFPILDWEERLAEATEALEELDQDTCGDPNLSNKVLGFLVYLEDIVSEIGILCIRQILAPIHVGTVIKAFVTLGFLLLSLVLSYLLGRDCVSHYRCITGAIRDDGCAHSFRDWLVSAPRGRRTLGLCREE